MFLSYQDCLDEAQTTFSAALLWNHLLLFFFSQKMLFFSHKLPCVVLSHLVVSDFVTQWNVARQAPLSMGILQERILERVTMPSSSVSCIAGGFFSFAGGFFPV